MSTVQIKTTRFGTIDVESKNFLTFVGPILGFEKIKNYILLDHSENSPFKWLQATSEPDLAFVVTNPKFFAIPYEFLLPDDAVDKLGIKKAEEVLVLTIVNIPENNPTLMTANLLAPIVVNQNNLNAMQVVLQDAKFSTRTRLLPDTALEKTASSRATSNKDGKD